MFTAIFERNPLVRVTESNALSQWLNDMMKQHGYSARKVSRLSGKLISHTAVISIQKGGPAGYQACAALAKAFNVPEEEVRELAGLD